MQFSYENQGSNSFLVYKLSENDKIDSFNYGMLANNKINNIIPALFSQVNSDEYLRYNISAKVTLKQYFEGVVNKKQIVTAFLSITKAMIDAQDYMLDTGMFVLDSDYIYVDVSTAEASIICFPIVGYSSGIKPYDFFKNLIFTTSFDQTENTDYVAKIISFLNSNNNFSVLDFKKTLLAIENTSEPKLVRTQGTVVNKQNQNINNFASTKQTSVPQQKKSQQAVSKPEYQQQPPKKNIPNEPQKINNRQIVQDKPNNIPINQNTNTSNAKSEMSLLHLLSHFSKENLEIYKSQSNSNSKSENDAKNQHNTTQKKKKEKSQAGNPVAGFNIPSGNGNSYQRTPNPQQPLNNNISNVQQNGMNRNQTQFNAVNKAEYNNANTQYPQAVKVENHTNSNISLQQESKQMPPKPADNSGFGDTSVLGSSLGTTVLGGGASVQTEMKNPRLIRSKNNETVLISKPVFRIGKEKSYVDYFISDNSAISRSHANIIIREGNYYIIDTNSTNHTYINGNMIPSNTEMPLNDKDMIKLGNEDFEFKIF